jgi:hypothetical protein
MASTSQRVSRLRGIVSHTIFHVDLDLGYHKDEKIYSYPCLNSVSTASCNSDRVIRFHFHLVLLWG